MRKFREFLSDYGPPVVVALAVIALVCFLFVPHAQSQVACTYTERQGAERNCQGVQTFNQLNSVVNGSGSITSGGAGQQALAPDKGRQFLYVANPKNATEPLYVGFATGVTATNSIALEPGGNITLAAGVTPVTAIYVMAATTGHPFVAISGN